MNHEIYTALSGALANERRQELVAHNLANVNSGGFRRESPLFSVVYDKLSAPETASPSAADALEHNCFCRHDDTWIDFQTGNMQDTGSHFDAALDGDGFFTFKSQVDGRLYYSRDGHFRLDRESRLTAMNGDLVMAAGAEDQPVELGVGENGQMDLKISSQGDIMLDGRPVGMLRLVRFDSPQGLDRLGDSGFLETSASGPPQPAENISVHQGVRELSNVNLIEEMVSMIEVARQYDNQQKIIVSMDELNKKAAQGIISA